MMQGIFAAQAAASDTPSETIARVNLALYKRGIESRFVTLMYGALEPDGRLTYCNAGHNPPLIIPGTPGGALRRLEVGGPIVGLFEAATFQEETVTLSPGDLLLVFSDGVSEALSADGEEYGEERIIETAHAHPGATPAELLQALFADVRTFTKGAAQSDDITAMVLRYGAT
jgi:sigma-B regulation protein RsbU (phosphoserine phosphatase)